eukprot:jgi/Mesvir1/7801/Mv11743-RA.1
MWRQAEKDSALLEAQLLSRLRHPNIVSCVESFIAGGKLCIVMDWCERGDLSEYLNKQTTLLKEDRVLDLFAQLCLGLKHVHDRKILHRDLKTQNVFLSNSGLAKLGDFGVSKVLHATMELAHTAVGTPYYLSPEICENRPYNNKSDVWSLGCILYEMCTLKHAFDAANFKMLIHKILRGIYPPISSTAYSKALSDLVTRMLQKNPRLRPSVNEILQLPLIRDRIQKCLSETMQAEEFNHTVLHKHRILDGPPPPRPSSAQGRIGAPQPLAAMQAPAAHPAAAPMPQRGMLSPPGAVTGVGGVVRPGVGGVAPQPAPGVRPPSSGMPDFKQRAVQAEKEREEAARRRAEEQRAAAAQAAREKEKEREREREKERLRQQERAKEQAREAAREKERMERKKAELRQAAEVEAQARRNREEAARRRKEMEERERDLARQNAKAEFMERQAQAAKNKAALYGGEDPYVEVHMPPNARRPAAFEPDPPAFGGGAPAPSAAPGGRAITPAKEDPTKKDLSEEERRRAYWEMREAAERNRRNVLASNQQAAPVTHASADEGERPPIRSSGVASYDSPAQASAIDGGDVIGARPRAGRKTWDQPDPAEKAKELEELRRRNYQEIRAAAERNRLRLMEELGVASPEKPTAGRAPEPSQQGDTDPYASAGGGSRVDAGLELSPITEDDTAEYAAMIDQMRAVVMNEGGGKDGGAGGVDGDDDEEFVEEDMDGGYEEGEGDEDDDDEGNGGTMRSSMAPILRNPAFQAISGKFLLDGSTLKLPNVTQSDSLGSRIEALRVFLEEKLGLDLFLEVYNRLEGVQEDDEDEDVAADLVAQLGPTKVGYLSLVHQLIICEESLNTSTMRE